MKMPINDNELQDRLNAIKNGKELPQPPVNNDYKWATQIPEQQLQDTNPVKNQIISLYKDIVMSLGRSIGVLITSILYGFGINAILSTMMEHEWTVWQILGLGFLFNHTLTVFPSSIKKLFTKKGV